MPEIKLEEQTFMCRKRVPLGGLLREGINVRPELFFKQELDVMLLDLSAHIFGEDLGDVEIVYPTNWWQAVKARFFPDWLLTKFPVVNTRCNIHAKALYPDISMPVRHPHIYVNSMDWNVR